jgi:hypothetical protein
VAAVSQSTTFASNYCRRHHKQQQQQQQQPQQQQRRRCKPKACHSVARSLCAVRGPSYLCTGRLYGLYGIKRH